MIRGWRIPAERRPDVTFRFEGVAVQAPEGESLAAALLASGIATLRLGPGDGGGRGAFCFMGLCQECIVEVDGERVEACRTPVAAGLTVSRVRYGANDPDV